MTASLRLSDEFESPVVDQDNPWPGLAAFGEAQADFFFGRQREVEDLFRRVRLNRLTVLYAQSGLGKTSLVRAALFPKLRAAGMLPVAIRLDYAAGAPPARAQIWQALAAALAEAKLAAPKLGEDQTLWEYFHQRALEVRAVPVLVFDQFEELFTLGTERAGGSGFVRDCLNELASLIENRPPDRVEARFDREPKLVAQYDFDRQDYRVLLSLREDYLAHLHDLAEKIPSITLNNMRLTALDGTRALEAVEKPGAARKLVAAGAAEAIVRVVAGARDERPERSTSGLFEHTGEHDGRGARVPLEALVVDPSLLSLLCRELNHKRQEERLPAITPMLVEANRENILNSFYARALAGLGDGVQVFVEEDLLTESGFRETLVKDSAEDKLRRRGADPRAIKVLENRRLVHFEQRGNVTRVELTHDVLAPVVRQSRTTRRDREALLQDEARKRRELEENERLAQQARAEAEAKYERSKRQRRLIALFGLGMAAVAAVAVLKSVQATRATARAEEATGRANTATKTADSAAQENARLVVSLSRTNAALSSKQDSLVKATESALRQQRKADSAVIVSHAMLDDFCSYALRVINRFGDSTSTKGNPDLTRAFNSLVEISDTSVDLMIGRSPAEVCPRRLDARILSVSTGLRLELGDTSKAIERGLQGMAASRHLLRWNDSLSRSIAAKSFGDLNYSLFFAKDDSLAFEAAREALPLTTTANAAHDRLAYDARARLYHYGALSLTHLKRLDQAHRWVDTGLVVAQEGRQRSDQNQIALLYTISQLYMRRAEIDTLQQRSSEALAAQREAVQAARQRMRALHNVPTHTWHAKTYGWYGDLARRLGQYEEGLTAHDSSSAQWQGFLREVGLTDTADAVTALDGIMWAERGKSAAALGLRRLPEALRYADASLDTAAALVRLRGSFQNRHNYALAFLWKADMHERMGQRVAADSAYRTAFRIDSVTLAASSRSDSATQRTAAEWFNSTASKLVPILRDRARADTAGKSIGEKQQILKASEETARRYREAEVLAWRRAQAVAPSRGRARADSLLASALGNVGWLYLLVDRPELGVDASAEALRLDKRQTYILPNYYNALILSGRDEDATAFFRTHETELVEDDPELFACAVVRDIRTLRDRGIANDRHVSLTEQLAAADLGKCRHKL